VGSPRSKLTKKLSACTAAVAASLGIVLSPPARAEPPPHGEAARAPRSEARAHPEEKRRLPAPVAEKEHEQPAARAVDVAVKRALARAIPIVDLKQSADDDQRPIGIVTSGGHGVAPRPTIDALVTAASETVIDASGRMSSAIERAPAAPKEKPVARPPATQRVLRRMNAGAPSFDADMRACADQHGVREAATVTLLLSVSPEGTVEQAQLTPPSVAPAPLLACVTAAISKAQFGPPGHAGASVALRVTVPAAKPTPQPEAVATQPNAKRPPASAN